MATVLPICCKHAAIRHDPEGSCLIDQCLCLGLKMPLGYDPVRDLRRERDRDVALVGDHHAGQHLNRRHGLCPICIGVAAQPSQDLTDLTPDPPAKKRNLPVKAVPDAPPPVEVPVEAQQRQVMAGAAMTERLLALETALSYPEANFRKKAKKILDAMDDLAAELTVDQRLLDKRKRLAELEEEAGKLRDELGIRRLGRPLKAQVAG